MKKILFVLLVGLCGVSFSFGGQVSQKCEDCVAKNKSFKNCTRDCMRCSTGHCLTTKHETSSEEKGE